MKTHFAVKVPFDLTMASACGIGRRLNDSVYAVDCLNCKSKDAFILAKDEADSAKHAAFMAQEPKKVSEPWHQPYGKVPMVCKECGNDTFRHKGRSCHGHYDDHACAKCGHIESRLTETGMSS